MTSPATRRGGRRYASRWGASPTKLNLESQHGSPSPSPGPSPFQQPPPSPASPVRFPASPPSPARASLQRTTAAATTHHLPPQRVRGRSNRRDQRDLLRHYGRRIDAHGPDAARRHSLPPVESALSRSAARSPVCSAARRARRTTRPPLRRSSPHLSRRRATPRRPRPSRSSSRSHSHSRSPTRPPTPVTAAAVQAPERAAAR